MRRYLALLGESVLEPIGQLGGVALLASAAARRLFRRPFEARPIIREIERMGFQSTGVVCLLGAFTGMVLVVQLGQTLKRLGASPWVSEMVALALVRELGPVLAGFIVAGRVGSGIAAELGAMAISEQIDAMKSLGADPVKKLVVPKAVAGLIALPILTAMANLIGMLGGMVMAKTMLNIEPSYYYSRIRDQLSEGDFAGGVFKTAAFGVIIALVSCYYGFRTTGGTEGVGKSATQSVVMSSVLILAADLIITSALFAIGGIMRV